MLHLHRDGGWMSTTRTIVEIITSEALSIQENGFTKQ